LASLICSSNQLTSLDVSNNTALTDLNCKYNKLTELFVGNNKYLKNLIYDPNKLTILNLIITNVHARQEGFKVIITYDMEGELQGEEKVMVGYSTDGGRIYKIISDAVGDLGKNVKPGTGREISLVTNNAFAGKNASFKVFFTLQTTPGSSWTFSNAGATGRLGPTQSQVNSAYAGSSLEGEVTIATQGIQLWTVPQTGNYTIETYGAQGGGPFGGKGARMKGSFSLNQGEVFSILVGHMGLLDGNMTSGGGGSFVAKGTQALVVSGGGGGARDFENNQTVTAGVTSTSGVKGYGTNASYDPGINGGGGKGGGKGGGSGGGGFSGNGTAEGVNRFGLSFSNGGLGGQATGGDGGNLEGGFGGGGGAGYNSNSIRYWGGGGGGGYSGGGSATADGDDTPPMAYGGGGGSYNSGTNQDNESGNNSGHGKVVITYVWGTSAVKKLPIEETRARLAVLLTEEARLAKAVATAKAEEEARLAEEVAVEVFEEETVVVEAVVEEEIAKEEAAPAGGIVIGVGTGFTVYTGEYMAEATSAPSIDISVRIPYTLYLGPLNVSVGAELQTYSFTGGDNPDISGIGLMGVVNFDIIETPAGAVYAHVGAGFLGSSLGITAGAKFDYPIPDLGVPSVDGKLSATAFLKANATLDGGEDITSETSSTGWANFGIALNYQL